MKIIGVTTCLTRTAHTYMAQEYLEEECRKRGFDVRIETQGGLGIKNELSEEDVAQTGIVILAVSVVIEGEERFGNKHILHTDVDEATSYMERLVDRAVILIEGDWQL